MMETAARTVVVITMAGAGSRFVHAGYTVPKYEIVTKGRTLFAWSMESLRTFIDAGCHFVFVARSMPNASTFVESECREMGLDRPRLITLDAVTDGQATTAMLAASEFPDFGLPVAIYNIDTFVQPFAISVDQIRGAGWIPCFPGEGEGWSFVAVDGDQRVTQVREKTRISPHASVGLYWFDSFARFADAYHRYYSRPQHIEARERYIAPLYNQLVEDGAEIFMHSLRRNQVFPLGTPEDVIAFQSQEPLNLT